MPETLRTGMRVSTPANFDGWLAEPENPEFLVCGGVSELQSMRRRLDHFLAVGEAMGMYVERHNTLCSLLVQRPDHEASRLIEALSVPESQDRLRWQVASLGAEFRWRDLAAAIDRALNGTRK